MSQSIIYFLVGNIRQRHKICLNRTKLLVHYAKIISF